MGAPTRCSISCAGSRASFYVVRDCLMRCAYQAYKIRSVQRRPDKTGRCIRQVSFRTDAKKPIRQTTDKTKGPVFRPGLPLLFDAWQFPTLAWGDPTLPSALRRFTSEFGMGSGGTTALQPPGKFCLLTRFSPVNLICIRLKICLFAKTPSAL